MKRKVNLLIIHCSDSDIGAHDNIETIKEWHKERGFNDIGYHYLIKKDGSVCTGRSEDTPGAHTRGHNSRSIGVCLSGRREFTREQFGSLERLAFDLCKKYGLEKSDILGHCDLNKNKTCPNFDLHKELASWGWH